MKKLIVYDTGFGNTRILAEVMGDSRSVDEVLVANLRGVELLVFGSPTLGGRAKPEMQEFLDRIPENGLKGIKVAVFDTRFLEEKQSWPLRLLLRKIGYAAPKMADLVTSKGGKLVVPPEGFIVIGKTGPLAEGEINRAKKWMKEVEKK